MSAELYNALKATATDLIAEFGLPVTFKRTTAGTTDPITGAQTGGSNGDFEAVGVVTTFSRNLIDGTTVREGDRLLVVESKTPVLMDDRPVLDGREWGIVGIEPAKPGTVLIVQRVHIRG